VTDTPVEIPVFTRVLAQAIHAANVEAGEKPKAFDTIFRHSDAGKCARQLWYSASGVERSDVVDLPGEMVMWYGTMIHEHWQAAMDAAFGDAFCSELPVRHHYDPEDAGLCSGHIDGVLNLEDTRYVFELKTKGGFGFNQAVGLDRQRYAMKEPAGPGAPALLQGALNALAVDADVLVMGLIGLEAVSRQLAGKLDLAPEARIMAEWHYSREQYAPWAAEELNRLELIAQDVRDGRLSPRKAVGDGFSTVRLDPNATRVDWRCTYCPYFDTCKGSPC
jgi:hypothetical protein